MNFLYVNYPSWIHPEIFPGVPFLGMIRWYGLMYVIAFVSAFFFLKRQMYEGALDSKDFRCNEDDIYGFLGCGIIFLLIGARLGSTLIYDTSGIYWQKPWLVFWPFDTKTGQFTGLAGMSYHGGFIGGIVGMIVWTKSHKKSFWQWADVMAVAVPLGYTFGRLGNFFNGELYGRITTMPWGMIFPDAELIPANQDWVSAFAAKAGITIRQGASYVNLPRHPSQLYEAFFEGICMFLLLWNIRKVKPFNGFLSCIYCIGYGAVRFVIEYFREPDADLGYRISKDGSDILYTNTSLLNISTGQILCSMMILAGIIILITLAILNKKGRMSPLPVITKPVKGDKSRESDSSKKSSTKKASKNKKSVKK